MYTNIKKTSVVATPPQVGSLGGGRGRGDGKCIFTSTRKETWYKYMVNEVTCVASDEK